MWNDTWLTGTESFNWQSQLKLTRELKPTNITFGYKFNIYISQMHTNDDILIVQVKERWIFLFFGNRKTSNTQVRKIHQWEDNDSRGKEGHRFQKKMHTMIMLMDSYRHHPSLLPTSKQPKTHLYVLLDTYVLWSILY